MKRYRVYEVDALRREHPLASVYHTKKEARAAAKRLKEAYPTLGFKVKSAASGASDLPAAWNPGRGIPAMVRRLPDNRVQIKIAASLRRKGKR